MGSLWVMQACGDQYLQGPAEKPQTEPMYQNIQEGLEQYVFVIGGIFCGQKLSGS